MGTKNVRLDEDVYERVRSRKHPDETFSEAIDLLIQSGRIIDAIRLDGWRQTRKTRTSKTPPTATKRSSTADRPARIGLRTPRSQCKG